MVRVVTSAALVNWGFPLQGSHKRALNGQSCSGAEQSNMRRYVPEPSRLEYHDLYLAPAASSSSTKADIRKLETFDPRYTPRTRSPGRGKLIYVWSQMT